MTDTLSTLTPEAKQFYKKTMLFRARQAQTFYKFGQMTAYGDNMGNQVSWRRINAFGLSTSPLTEGATPTSTPISISEVTTTVGQYGNYVGISDALNKLGIDKIMSEVTPALGQNAGESVEKVVANTIQAGTTVIYATGSSRAAQSTSNPISLALFRKALTTLDAANTHRFTGPEENDRIGQGHYVAFVHPYVVYDIFNDQELKNAFQYHSNDRLYDGSIGSIYGIEIFQSTLCPIFTGAGSGGANVYATIVVGQEAFGVLDIGGSGKFEMIVKEIGSSGSDDPLNQRGTVGWKAWQAPTILNNSFFLRIESGATIG